MKRIITLITLTLSLTLTGLAQTTVFNELMREAQISYQEVNFIRAFELYVKAGEKAVNNEQRVQAEKKIEQSRNAIIGQQAVLRKALDENEKNLQGLKKAHSEIEEALQKADQAREKAEEQQRIAIENQKLTSFYMALSFQYMIDSEQLNKFLDWVYLKNLNEDFDEVLKILIRNSKSFEDESKQIEWFNLLPMMNAKHKIRLFDILAREKTKLQFLNWDFEERKTALNITKDFQQAKIIELEDKLVNVKLVNVLIEMGMQHFNSENYEKAIECYLASIEKNNTVSNAATFGNVGLCYRLLGDYENALKYLYKRLDFDENNIWALRQVSFTYDAMKQYNNGYEITQRLILLEADNYSNWWNHSFYCLFVGKYDEAIVAAQKSFELEPKQNGVITNLALAYLLNNEWSKAEPLYIEWKDKKFYNQDRYANEIFLKDIQDLEEAGISHPDFEKVKKMMLE